MKPSKLYEALHALIGERVPLHIWGACGVGKSQIVAQVANDLDYDFLDVRAVQLDPVDLRGLPRIAADQTEWVPPKFLPTTGKGILFLDELTSAPQMRGTEDLWKRLREVVAHKYGSIGWHTFRHTYRSWLDETGAPMGVQQKLMRHAQISTTMNVYGNALMEAKREANAAVVNRILRSA